MEFKIFQTNANFSLRFDEYNRVANSIRKFTVATCIKHYSRFSFNIFATIIFRMQNILDYILH